MAILKGIDGDLFELRFSDIGNYPEFDIVPFCCRWKPKNCRILTEEVAVSEAAYALPDLQPLKNLLGGDSGSRFQFDEKSVFFEIIEHQLGNGPRFGLIVVGSFYELGSDPATPWIPAVPDLLLMNQHSLGQVKFGFRVEHDELSQFCKKLDKELFHLDRENRRQQ